MEALPVALGGLPDIESGLADVVAVTLGGFPYMESGRLEVLPASLGGLADIDSGREGLTVGSRLGDWMLCARESLGSAGRA